MVQRVTDPDLWTPSRVEGIPEAFLHAFPAVSVTGPGTTLVGDPATQVVVMRCSWPVENRGGASGRAGLRVNLQIDSAFGDVSQLIIETNRAKAGALAAAIAIRPLTNTPLTVPAGGLGTVFVEFDIPVFNMLDRQGTVTGFNWWIVELTLWDVDKGSMAKMLPDMSAARYEIRDWFKVTKVAPPAAVSDLVAAASGSAVAYIEAFV